jgi:hypothetical protein
MTAPDEKVCSKQRRFPRTGKPQLQTFQQYTAPTLLVSLRGLNSEGRGLPIGFVPGTLRMAIRSGKHVSGGETSENNIETGKTSEDH